MFDEPSIPRRDRQKAETRAHILAVARDLLEAHGYEATSLRRVAREAGVSPATVVFHVGDKPGLLHAALHAELEAVVAAAVHVPPAAGPLLPWLRGVLERFFAFYARRPALSRALLSHSLLADGVWGERFRAQYEAIAAVVTARLVAARECGEVPASLEPRVFVTAFFSFYLFQLVDAARAGFEDVEPRLDLVERQLGFFLVPLGDRDGGHLPQS